MRQGLRYKTKKTRLIFVVFFVAYLTLPAVVSAQGPHPSLAEKIRPRIIDFVKPPLSACAKAIKAVYNIALPRNRYEQKIEQLNQRIASLTSAAVLTRETADENQRLRQLLDFKNKFPQKSVAAEVISRNPASPESFVIIDKGTLNGVNTNAAVFKSEGLIGRVFEAGENTAKVMLIDSPGFRLGVAVQRTREQGVLAGLGAGLCKITYLPLDTQAKPGDIVVTSELSGLPVKGMMIGRITKVTKGQNSLYSNAIVKPASNLFRVEEVLCAE